MFWACCCLPPYTGASEEKPGVKEIPAEESGEGTAVLGKVPSVLFTFSFYLLSRRSMRHALSPPGRHFSDGGYDSCGIHGRSPACSRAARYAHGAGTETRPKTKLTLGYFLSLVLFLLLILLLGFGIATALFTFVFLLRLGQNGLALCAYLHRFRRRRRAAHESVARPLLAPRYSARIMADSKHPFDVLVAGGGNAGLCAAISARRAGAQVLVLESAIKDFRGGNSRHTRDIRYMHKAATAYVTGPTANRSSGRICGK